MTAARRLSDGLAVAFILLVAPPNPVAACLTRADCNSHGSCVGVDSVTKPPTQGTCSCARGWSGDTCSDGNPCDGNPCGAHGTCTASGASHSCACSSGWSGTTCRVDPCTGYDCGHGTCHGNKECTCAAGYSGNTCQSSVCDGVSCNGHGSCQIIGGGQASCSCDSGYSGPTCEVGAFRARATHRTLVRPAVPA